MRTSREFGSFHTVKQEGCRTPSPREPMSPSTAPLSSSSSGTLQDHATGHVNVPNPFGNSGLSSVPIPATTVSMPPKTYQWDSNNVSFEAPNVSSNSANSVPTSPANSSIPAVVSAASGVNTWSVANSESCPNFNVGTTSTAPSPGRKGGRRRYGKTGKESGNESVTARRQKRLERNRESARLSRRRRKQYLEVLEDRVSQLSFEMDKGRREHVKNAVSTVLSKRRDALEAADKPEGERVHLLDTGLSRTSAELMLATTFKTQQLKSFSLPPHSKFYLWLTLQSDAYFRGGRAASERLSAARIGERMLSSGNDRVTPSQSMWPLFCNEVGLSYDQEEKVRNMQRTLLQSDDSWLERHTGKASDLVMASTHDATQALSVRLGQRERAMLSVLSNTQRLKFLSWTERNRDRIAQVMKEKGTKTVNNDDKFKVCKSQHTAANLYIINHRLRQLLNKIPRAQPQVSPAELKKLSRRPSFESLGRAGEKGGKDDDSLSRENSYASSGSLKRSASSLSMDDQDQDRPQVQPISPDEAEATAAPTVEKVLGFVKELIPPPPTPEYVTHSSSSVQLRIPSPTHVTSTPLTTHNHNYPTYTYGAPVNHAPVAPTGHHHTHHLAPAPYAPHPEYSQVPHHHQPLASAPVYALQEPVPYGSAPAQSPLQTPAHQMALAPGPAPTASTAPPSHQGRGHVRQSSFLPPHLNVVPEEMFPADATEDFLMGLVADEDWAIGEGIDMDTTE